LAADFDASHMAVYRSLRCKVLEFVVERKETQEIRIILEVAIFVFSIALQYPILLNPSQIILLFIALHLLSIPKGSPMNGKTIEHYRVTEEVGGEMVVHRVSDPRLVRKALPVLLVALALFGLAACQKPTA
jgi:hypothetical protein